MEYSLLDKINAVAADYKVNDSTFAWKRIGSGFYADLLLGKNELIVENAANFILTNYHLIYSYKGDEIRIHSLSDNDTVTVKGDLYGIPDKELIFIRIDREQVDIYNYLENDKVGETSRQTIKKSMIFDGKIISSYGKGILRILPIKETGVNLEVDLEELRITDIKGVWNDHVLLSCDNHTILSVDMKSGAILQKWKDMDVSNSNPYYRTIGRPNDFVLDQEKGELMGVFNRCYIKIDLESTELEFTYLDKELDKYNMQRLKPMGIGTLQNPYTDTHVFLTAEFKQHPSDPKWSHDCVLTLNRNTFEVDWFYPFEEQNLGTHIPKLAGNKLYQLDNNGTLHIFQRTDDSLPR